MKKQETEDGFQLVTHKKKGRRNHSKHIRKTDKEIKNSSGSYKYSISKDSYETFQFSNIFKEKMEELKNTSYFLNFKEKLCCVLKNLDTNMLSNYDAVNYNEKFASISLNDNAIDIVCYGLGPFERNYILHYQLALLTCLKECLQSSSTSIYDPIFSDEEKMILKDLSLNVLAINEKAIRIVSNRTIFFMPHCDAWLYNNLLWANWHHENLSNLIIIGNSFQSYILNQPSSKLQSDVKYVYLASQFVLETKINNDFHIYDAFNDLSIHYFKAEKMPKIGSDIWNKTKEPPVYS